MIFGCRLAVKVGFEDRIATFFNKIAGVVEEQLDANIRSFRLCKFMLKELVLFNDGKVSVQSLLDFLLRCHQAYSYWFFLPNTLPNLYTNNCISFLVVMWLNKFFISVYGLRRKGHGKLSQNCYPITPPTGSRRSVRIWFWQPPSGEIKQSEISFGKKSLLSVCCTNCDVNATEINYLCHKSALK